MSSINKKVVFYKILIILGCLPFVGILCFAIFSSIYGFTFLYSTSYGFDAFLGSILLPSLFLWPLYIIGIALITIGSLKIRKFKKSKIIQNERDDYILINFIDF